MAAIHTFMHANGNEQVKQSDLFEAVEKYGALDGQVNVLLANGDWHRYYAVQGRTVGYVIDEGLLTVSTNDETAHRVYSTTGWVAVDGDTGSLNRVRSERRGSRGRVF